MIISKELKKNLVQRAVELNVGGSEDVYNATSIKGVTLMRELVLEKVGYYLLWEKGTTFYIPYPDKEDKIACSKDQFLTIDGYEMIFNTINSELPLPVREAALDYVLHQLSDKQLLELLVSAIEDSEAAQ